MKTETPEQAAARIQAGGWNQNCALVIMAFAARGIDPDDIKPKDNVLTYRAWRGRGRQVRKGEHGETITTYIPIEKKNKKTGKTEESVRPRSCRVFHISQTDPIEKK